MYKNPCLMVDAYKLGHYFQMPEGVETIYSTWTARHNNYHPGCPNTVVFGTQGFIKEYLVDFFNEHFFNEDINIIEHDFNRKISALFHPSYTSFERFRDLHALGYLPICVMGVPEGTILPPGIPDHIIFNTDSRFAWLPQYLEDLWSCHNWMPSTSATTAYYRRKLMEPYVKATCENPTAALRHMCGDFSMRGMPGEDAAYSSTAGHLLSFDRTATVEGNAYLEQYYGADLGKDPPGLGVPSLEHSVVCQNVAYYKELLATGNLPKGMTEFVKEAVRDNWDVNLIGEMCFMLHLLWDVQPQGMLTYVSDTYDYWGVVSKILPVIKPVILHRDGCFSIRPDSGDPVKIICGDIEAMPGSPEFKGTLFLLKEIFGGSINDKGFFELDPHIRMIYGDAITPKITESVCQWCKYDGHFAVNNVAFGIGAYTYQYVTRDTRGYAIKATDAYIRGIGELPLYKDPKTDPGKRSPRGAVALIKDKNGDFKLVQNLTVDESMHYPGNLYVEKFRDGAQDNFETIYQIRDRLWEGNF